eukprot:m51a1_g4033 hypothetical protein (977) ;mRNA; r:655181-658282
MVEVVHKAAESGCREAVQSALCRYPHLLNALDAQGRTPLHVAVLHSCAWTTEALVRGGADLAALWEGKTALDLALQRQFASGVDLLWRAGAPRSPAPAPAPEAARTDRTDPAAARPRLRIVLGRDRTDIDHAALEAEHQRALQAARSSPAQAPRQAAAAGGDDERAVLGRVLQMLRATGGSARLVSLPRQYALRYQQPLSHRSTLKAFLQSSPALVVSGSQGQETVALRQASTAEAAAAPQRPAAQSEQRPAGEGKARLRRHYNNWHVSNNYAEGQRPSQTQLFARPLERFPMPAQVAAVIRGARMDHWTALAQITAILEAEIGSPLALHEISSLTLAEYVRRSELLLWAEEVQMAIDIRQYDLDGVAVPMDYKNPHLHVIRVAGLAEKRPSVLRGDAIYARTHGQTGPQHRVQHGFVHYVNLEDIRVSFDRSFSSQGNRWDVEFTFTRTPLRLMHRAVRLCTEDVLCLRSATGRAAPQKLSMYNRMLNVLGLGPDSTQDAAAALPKQSLYNKLLNEEQVAAVAAVMQRPRSPVVIFGPPGTGKTVTVVEAIMQTMRVPGSRLLVCAPSNEAVDLICVRLLERGVDSADILRLNSHTRCPRDIREELKPCCAPYYDGGYSIPEADYYEQFRVVASTCCSAGYLYSVDLSKGFFTHIFVDEAGHALEPETLIPLQLAERGNTTVVLAGDPRQLGPIIRSPVALYYNLDVSLLERLVESKATNVIRLRKTYRSHPLITDLYANLFYEGDLVAMATPRVDSRLTAVLPNPACPMVFTHVDGVERREQDSPSWYNPSEIDEVYRLLLSLVASGVPTSEIAVIAPYRKQVEKIKGLVHSQRHMLDGVHVGTVEFFQGSEHTVVIISCVRSNRENVAHDVKFRLGFMHSKKRLNVAISRAKSMLAIVGNAHLLCSDPTWSSMIRTFVDRGAYVGVLPPGLYEGSEAVPDEADVADAEDLLTPVDIESSAAFPTTDVEWRNMI